MRVSYGVLWSESVEKAIKTLGELVFDYTCQQKNELALHQDQKKELADHIGNQNDQLVDKL
jgi:hypothetical protein